MILVSCEQFCASRVPALSAGKGEACCTKLLLVSSLQQQAALLLSDLSCLFTAWSRARVGCCWDSRPERSAGRSGACQQPSNLTCWQQDGGAAPRKIREGATTCLEKGDFSAALSTDALAGEMHDSCHLNIAVLYFLGKLSF